MEPLVNEHVVIDGSRIAYGSFGHGEPVVLLHGTPSSSLIWRNVVPKLVSAGYCAYVYDLLGFGLSERPFSSKVDTSISGQVPVLEGLLQHWKLDKFHLVAHDIGGGVAQRFAVFRPERLRSLTLIDVVSYDSYPSERTKEQMQAGLESLMKASDKVHREHFRRWLLSAVKYPQRLAESSLDTYLGYISGPIGQVSLFEHQVRHYDSVHTMSIADRLPELGQRPVKLIWGADDAWQVPSWAQKLLKTIPESELSILENCGHFAPEDQPDSLSELLIEFLGRV